MFIASDVIQDLLCDISQEIHFLEEVILFRIVCRKDRGGYV